MRKNSRQTQLGLEPTAVGRSLDLQTFTQETQVDDRIADLLKHQELHREIASKQGDLSRDPTLLKGFARQLDENFSDAANKTRSFVSGCSLDSRTLNLLGESTLNAFQRSTGFRETEFADKLVQKYNLDTVGQQPCLSNNCVLGAIGAETRPVLSSTPYLRTLFGLVTFSKTSDCPKESKSVARPGGTQRSSVHSPTKIERVVTCGLEGDSLMSVKVRCVLQCLERECHLQNGPVQLVRFAFHPTSYSKTLQHLYLISVLLKEGKVTTKRVEGVTTLRPVVVASSEQTSRDFSNSFIVSLSFDEWKSLKTGEDGPPLIHLDDDFTRVT